MVLSTWAELGCSRSARCRAVKAAGWSPFEIRQCVRGAAERLGVDRVQDVARQGHCLGRFILHVPAAGMAADINPGQDALGARIGGIDPERLAQQGHCDVEAGPGEGVEMRQSAKIPVVGIKVLDGLFLRPVDLRRLQAWLDGADDPLRDAVLQLEHFGQAALEPVGPDVVSRRRFDQLAGDAHPPARLADAALQDVADAEVASDLFDVRGAPFVFEARVAGDDEEPARPRQGGDDVLGHAVGKVILFGIAAHVGEWQDGERWLVRRCGWRWDGLGDVVFGHLADEANAAAGDGADQALRCAAVADRLAHGVQAGCQGRFGHGPAAPDGLDQIVLADDAAAVADEVDEDVEDLRFDGDGAGSVAQFAAIDIEEVVTECEGHHGGSVRRNGGPFEKKSFQ